MTRTRSVVLLALSFLAPLAACSDDTTSSSATSSSTASSSTSRPADASTTAAGRPSIAPGEVGPYRVGRRTITATDTARQRSLTVDVWYPVDPAATGAPSRYSFLPAVAFDSKLALDAPPLAGGGPFPLVVYSHGSGGLRYVAAFFTETLASHGFVVVAPDHTGNTAIDAVGSSSVSDEQNELNRVADVQFVIGDMLARSGRNGDPFRGGVDSKRIGVTGHSFGGFTALATPVGYANSLGSVPSDPRIRAVVAMAPYSKPIGDAGLAALQVPTLLMTGTKDETTPIADETERPWDHVAGRPLQRVDIVDAAHQSFTDVCDYQRMEPDFPEAPKVLIDMIDRLALEGCGAGFLDVERVHRIADTFAIAFLEVHVAGDHAYDTYLTDEGASKVAEVRFSSKR